MFLLGRKYNNDNTTTFWEYDLDTFTLSSYVINFIFENAEPAIGARFTYKCKDGDLYEYFYQGGINAGTPQVTYTVEEGSLSCCELQLSNFAFNKSNNTSLETPNGTITITANGVNINDYKASIDNGATFVTAQDNKITFTGLSKGFYNIYIEGIDVACNVSTSNLEVGELITYPPLMIQEVSTLSDFLPVFYPIEFQYQLLSNAVTINEDLAGTYLQTTTQDGIDFLATLPIIKILNNTDYGGVVEVVSVDDPNNPTKFYINKAFTTAQAALFVPFGKQTFKLYAERSEGVFNKIADIAVSPDIDGIYKVRVEGFLQSVFSVNPPAVSNDMSLSKKFYVIPDEFDLVGSATIRTAVYSAVPDLVPYQEELTPLGPEPINFINEQSQKGYPVLFSYLNLETKRVNNVYSSSDTNIVTSSNEIFIPALPYNFYNLNWISPIEITDLITDPTLPDWIEVTSTSGGTVKLNITTFSLEGGEYDANDFNPLDYNVGSLNGIVGCHTFDFFNGSTFLFTLRICVYPAQGVESVCKKGANNPIYNIAWVNQEGGWSSFIFEGKKELRRNIGKIGSYKRGNELKKSYVEGVYKEVTVSFGGKNQTELEFIAGMRTAIQHYLYNDSTQAWDIPIFIEKENFPVYSLPYKQIEQEGTFTFLYSNEIPVQRQ